MLQYMSNDAANRLINEFGGFAALNRAFAEQGLTQTVFERSFGDTGASDTGLENYTSARDAVKVLSIIFQGGNHTYMRHNLTSDGFTVPSGATINAHRGQGIGGVYNVYAVISAGSAIYGITVITMHPGRTIEQARVAANSSISSILAQVHSVMLED